MKIKRIKRFGAIFFAFLLMTLFMGYGCKSGLKVDELLPGPWQMFKDKVHFTLTFEAKGSWAIENKVEGKTPKSTPQKGKISGQWFYTNELEGEFPEKPSENHEADLKENEKPEKDKDEKKQRTFLVMSVSDSPDEDKDWEKGATKPFEIVQLDKEKLVLMDPDGTIVEWSRLPEGENKDKTEEGTINTSLGAIVVNLNRTKVQHKRRFLCLDVDIVTERPHQGDKEPSPELKLHPRIREAAIFYLSSKTYQDLRTVEKVETIMGELTDVLNPYLKNTIKGFEINQLMVTADKKTVEDFENDLLKKKQEEGGKENTEKDEEAEAEEAEAEG